MNYHANAAFRYIQCDLGDFYAILKAFKIDWYTNNSLDYPQLKVTWSLSLSVCTKGSR